MLKVGLWPTSNAKVHRRLFLTSMSLKLTQSVTLGVSHSVTHSVSQSLVSESLCIALHCNYQHHDYVPCTTQLAKLISANDSYVQCTSAHAVCHSLCIVCVNLIKQRLQLLLAHHSISKVRHKLLPRNKTIICSKEDTYTYTNYRLSHRQFMEFSRALTFLFKARTKLKPSPPSKWKSAFTRTSS